MNSDQRLRLTQSVNIETSDSARQPPKMKISRTMRGFLSSQSEVLCRLVSFCRLMAFQDSGVSQRKKCWPQLCSSPAI